MRIKKFVAGNMAEAMLQVKTEFGDDAVILHTRRRPQKKWLRLFFRPKVEVIAALDKAAAAGKPVPERRKQPQPEVGSTASFPRVLQQTEKRLGSGAAVIEANSGSGNQQSEHLETGSLRVVEVGIGDDEALSSVYRRLLRQEVDEQIAASIVKKSVDTDQREEWEIAEVRQRVRQTIASLIKSADVWTDCDHRVVALVGPTGVGKTTTIAKLAANYSLLSGQKVGLITIDTYRIAAVEQLRTYAEIIKVPISVAYTPQELRQALREHEDKNLVLIDTAGRNARNQMRMQELRAFLEVASPDETHLVLSATTRNRDLDDIVARFSEVNFDRLIFTKLDEASAWGCLVNQVVKTGKPISYLTDGQQVPDDIEVVDAAKISDFILGDESSD